MINVHWVKIYTNLDEQTIRIWWAHRPNDFWDDILGLETQSSPVPASWWGILPLDAGKVLAESCH